MDLMIQAAQGTNYYVGNQLFDAVRAEAAACFAAQRARKAAIATAEEARRYQQEKRAFFLEAIGGLPEERTALHPVTTGVTQRAGYRIERLHFQSLPDFHIPGLLYVPEALREARNPAVLFVCGHWGLSKAVHEYQRVCQELVRAGFVVLAIDPVGQGERQQTYLPGGGYARLSPGVPEHTQFGLQCMLAGSNLARYYVWDMLRAVDLLAGLPYVDAARIGITGNSGGGTQTSYAMLADERLAAAVPCTFLNDRELYLNSGQPHDSEQNIFGAISGGLGYDDALIAFAPKPALVGAARFDFFHLKGVDACMTSARHFYRLLGREEDCALAVADTEHTYGPVLRTAAANFFLQHLGGLPSAYAGHTDEELALEPLEVVSACRTGNVVAEFPGERRLWQLNRDYLQARQAERAAPAPATVARVLGIADKLPLRANSTWRIECTWPGDPELYEFNGIIRQRVEYFAEDDIFLTGFYYQERRTEGTRPPLWLVVPEDGLADGRAINDRVLDLLWGSNAVFVCDVRGTGVGASHPIGPRARLDQYGAEFMMAFDYLMLGRSLPGLRAFDLLRAIDCLAEMGRDVDLERIHVHGYGLGALYALFAAALEPRIAGGVLEGMIPSYQSIVDTELYRLHCPERMVVHGILRHFDIPDLLQALAPRTFELRAPLLPGGAGAMEAAR